MNNRLKNPIIAIAIAFLTGLMATVQLPWRSHLAQSIQDTSHILVSGLLALMIHRLLGDRWAGDKRKILAILMALALTTAAETVQWVAGRPFEIFDMGLNAAGAVVAMMLIAPATSLSRLSALVILFAAVSPLLSWVSAYVSRASAFPTLIECGKHWSAKFIKTDHAQVSSFETSIYPETPDPVTACMISISPGAYPGIEIDEPARDWSDYDYLVISFRGYSSLTTSLTIRIHDKHHNQAYDDRYNYRFALGWEPTTLRIDLDEIKAAPANRSMDMHQIAGIMIFASHPDSEISFMMFDPMLEKHVSDDLFND